ncbi:lipoprotein [Arthrobacter sp. MWB30]|nr:lipoprotein [Arthrobacter sp. MWB30]
MKNKVGFGLGALIVAAALAGCGSSSGTSTSAPPSAASSSPAASTAAGAEMKTASSSAGQIVVDSKGMSLYFFTKDVKDSGTSACTGACLQAWPVFTTTSDAPGVDGVTGTVGTIATPDGKKQVTLNGMPLYYYAKDKAAGDVTGQGVGGVWYLVSPSGEMIKGAAASGY